MDRHNALALTEKEAVSPITAGIIGGVCGAVMGSALGVVLANEEVRKRFSHRFETIRDEALDIFDELRLLARERRNRKEKIVDAGTS